MNDAGYFAKMNSEPSFDDCIQQMGLSTTHERLTVKTMNCLIEKKHDLQLTDTKMKSAFLLGNICGHLYDDNFVYNRFIQFHLHKVIINQGASAIDTQSKHGQHHTHTLLVSLPIDHSGGEISFHNGSTFESSKKGVPYALFPLSYPCKVNPVTEGTQVILQFDVTMFDEPFDDTFEVSTLGHDDTEEWDLKLWKTKNVCKKQRMTFERFPQFLYDCPIHCPFTCTTAPTMNGPAKRFHQSLTNYLQDGGTSISFALNKILSNEETERFALEDVDDFFIKHLNARMDVQNIQIKELSFVKHVNDGGGTDSIDWNSDDLVLPRYIDCKLTSDEYDYEGYKTFRASMVCVDFTPDYKNYDQDGLPEMLAFVEPKHVQESSHGLETMENPDEIRKTDRKVQNDTTTVVLRDRIVTKRVRVITETEIIYPTSKKRKTEHLNEFYHI